MMPTVYLKLASNKHGRGANKLQRLLGNAVSVQMLINQLDSNVQRLVVQLKVLLYLYKPVHKHGPHGSRDVGLAAGVVTNDELELLLQTHTLNCHFCQINRQN
jgi:hypothetical protein